MDRKKKILLIGGASIGILGIIILSSKQENVSEGAPTFTTKGETIGGGDVTKKEEIANDPGYTYSITPPEFPAFDVYDWIPEDTFTEPPPQDIINNYEPIIENTTKKTQSSNNNIPSWGNLLLDLPGGSESSKKQWIAKTQAIEKHPYTYEVSMKEIEQGPYVQVWPWGRKYGASIDPPTTKKETSSQRPTKAEIKTDPQLEKAKIGFEKFIGGF